jgi:hypothetical protein
VLQFLLLFVETLARFNPKLFLLIIFHNLRFLIINYEYIVTRLSHVATINVDSPDLTRKFI